MNIKARVQELKDIPRYGNLRGMMIAYCRQDWFDYCIQEAMENNSANLFDILLKGC